MTSLFCTFECAKIVKNDSEGAAPIPRERRQMDTDTLLPHTWSTIGSWLLQYVGPKGAHSLLPLFWAFFWSKPINLAAQNNLQKQQERKLDGRERKCECLYVLPKWGKQLANWAEKDWMDLALGGCWLAKRAETGDWPTGYWPTKHLFSWDFCGPWEASIAFSRGNWQWPAFGTQDSLLAKHDEWICCPDKTPTSEVFWFEKCFFFYFPFFDAILNSYNGNGLQEEKTDSEAGTSTRRLAALSIHPVWESREQFKQF